MDYQLGFVSDDDLLKHVEETVSKYSFSTVLSEMQTKEQDLLTLLYGLAFHHYEGFDGFQFRE